MSDTRHGPNLVRPSFAEIENLIRRYEIKTINTDGTADVYELDWDVDTSDYAIVDEDTTYTLRSVRGEIYGWESTEAVQGDRGLAWTPPGVDWWEQVNGDEEFRFVMTASLSLGGSAEVKLAYSDFTTDDDSPTATVYDTLEKFAKPETLSGQDGCKGIAKWWPGSGKLEILDMELPAEEIEFVLADSEDSFDGATVTKFVRGKDPATFWEDTIDLDAPSWFTAQRQATGHAYWDDANLEYRVDYLQPMAVLIRGNGPSSTVAANATYTLSSPVSLDRGLLPDGTITVTNYSTALPASATNVTVVADGAGGFRTLDGPCP